jgi:hypothetical protein
MDLIGQLSKKKDAIVNKWFTLVVDTYPPETARFLRSQKDPFANPVGQTTIQSLRTLIDLLAGSEMEAKALRNALDPVLRIRAIQEFSPAQATRFVFGLKNIIREIVLTDHKSFDELRRIDDRIDEMALAAFDVYMLCREKIFEMKATEMKSRTYKAMVRAGLIKESDDD